MLLDLKCEAQVSQADNPKWGVPVSFGGTVPVTPKCVQENQGTKARN